MRFGSRQLVSLLSLPLVIIACSAGTSSSAGQPGLLVLGRDGATDSSAVLSRTWGLSDTVRVETSSESSFDHRILRTTCDQWPDVLIVDLHIPWADDIQVFLLENDEITGEIMNPTLKYFDPRGNEIPSPTIDQGSWYRIILSGSELTTREISISWILMFI